MLSEWITANVQSDDDNAANASNAAIASAFIDPQYRNQLFELGRSHSSRIVRLEAAWAAATAGEQRGYDLLVQLCRDVTTSISAREYLEGFHQSGLIPAEAKEDAFEARARFANWLSHPNELGSAPTEITVVDSREFFWPAEQEKLKMWLLQYHMSTDDSLEPQDVGIGLVGSMSWCFFDDTIERLPHDDIYAIHAAFECQQGGYISSVEKLSQNERKALLEQWTGSPLSDVKILDAVRISRKLKYPQRTVGLATAIKDSEEGFAVFDGTRSRWYPRHDFAADFYSTYVLRIHVGRNLLGMPPIESRKLAPANEKQIAAEEVIRQYSELIKQASSAESESTTSLSSIYSPTSKHFDRFVLALERGRGQSHSQSFVEAYDLLLSAAANLNREQQAEAFGMYSALGMHLDGYIQAAISIGVQDKAKSAILQFASGELDSHDHARLGELLFDICEFGLAEKHLNLSRQSQVDIDEGRAMSCLAEIWSRQNRTDEARKLLIECMRNCSQKVDAAQSDADSQPLRRDLKYHQATYARLFSGDGSKPPEFASPLPTKP